MDSFAPPASLPEAHAPQAVRTLIPTLEQKTQSHVQKEAGPAAQAAAEQLATRKAELSDKVLPDRLVVERDEAAGRFVQTVLDRETEEVQLRYPNETQLAFSRAVAAYMRTMSDS